MTYTIKYPPKPCMQCDKDRLYIEANPDLCLACKEHGKMREWGDKVRGLAEEERQRGIKK